MTIEEMIEKILSDAGMLDGWTDRFGDDQPAPVVQTLTFRESDIGNNRAVVIRESGGLGEQAVGVIIYFVGYEDKSDAVVCKGRAQQIKSIFRHQHEEQDIITVNIQSYALPVMFTESGRPIINIELEVLTNEGYCS